MLFYSNLLIFGFFGGIFGAQTTETVLTNIANALIGAIFPDAQREQQQTDAQQYWANQQRSPQIVDPLQQQQRQFFARNSPFSTSFDRSLGLDQLSLPILSNKEQTSAAAVNNGVALPPADFTAGSPPLFSHLSNPDNQQSALFPSAGLQGRTDLPADYVYPFAPAGSLLKPPGQKGMTFKLGPTKDQVFLHSNPVSSNDFLNFNTMGKSFSPQLPSSAATIRNDHLGFDSGATGANNVFFSPDALLANSQQQPRLPSPQPSVLNAFRQNIAPISPPLSSVDNFGQECPQCIALDFNKMAGPWIEVYGNPNALRNILTSLSSLQELYGDGSFQAGDRFIQPSCVGYQFSRPYSMTGDNETLESTMNLFFRDNGPNKQLNEVSSDGKCLCTVIGKLKQDASNPKRFVINLPSFNIPMCAVKVSSSYSTMYSYVILTETIGVNRCQSYHVLGRQSQTFFRDHNRLITSFLKNEVDYSRAKPVTVLPFPDLCQLQSSIRR
uniref:Uncharacterized protein n=1 Tax=Romanomermis culicivorax TaxID=13658 RepID=A0A915J988_ROMCU